MSIQPVTLSAFQSQSQRNIEAFLSPFFDGNAHNVGTNSYTFPKCIFKFSRQQIPRSLSVPWIIVEFSTGAKPDVIWAGTTKMKTRRDAVWRMIVVTEDHNQATAPNWINNDKISDLLQLVLNHCRPLLAAGGQRIIKVGPGSKEFSPQNQFFVLPVVIRSDMSHDNGS